MILKSAARTPVKFVGNSFIKIEFRGTKFLIDRYKDKRLNACVKADLEKYREKFSEGKQNIDEISNFLMTFKEFNVFSNKNKPLSIKEMFAKCLMKIQGISQEKVIPIVELYPTPSQ